jgi:hypothetical protein
MASTTGVSSPIQERVTVSGNQPQMRRYNEAATQTFKRGVPVILDANGNVAEWGGSTLAIAGISKEPGASLTTAGVAKQQTFDTVPNEPLAAQLSRPYFNDGQNGFVVANADTLWYAQVGTTTVAGDRGKHYGLTKDTDGQWYVDKAKTTDGTNTVVEVVDLDYWDTTRGVIVKFLPSVCQLG